MPIVSSPDTWVKRFNPNPEATLRLFCFPYAGAGASIFRQWSASLATSVDVCAIQLPGREDRLRDKLFTHISPLVEALALALHPYLDIPFAFFGHSMGALISFELARQLRAIQAPEPIYLFVSGRRAPQLGDRNPLIHTLPEPDFLQELRYLNKTPEPVLANKELMQLFLPMLRADFSICGTYTYTNQAPLTCPIAAFGGLDDLDETADLLEAWSSQTSSSFSLQMFPGDHFFLHPSQQQLLTALDSKLMANSD